MKSSRPFHFAYVAGSFAAALIAVVGVLCHTPLLYATVPGIIGGISAAIATVRLLKAKTDLAGFVATICGFMFYQAFQANPVTQHDFVESLQSIPIQDQATGLFLGNLTTAMLLISCHIMGNCLHRMIGRWVPDPAWVTREKTDPFVRMGFWVVFALVALPNLLFGKVVMGSIDGILYLRKAAVGDEIVAGYANWGGAVGQSSINMALWATSLLILWLYLLNSKYWKLMLVLAPLILLWAAGVGLQGSRTYLVTMGIAVIVYLMGNPKLGRKVFVYAIWGGVALFLCLQVSTIFRSGGLQSVNLSELSAHMFEIRGNEGASAQIDGMQYFRTDLMENGKAANPIIGFFRGVVERPIEGLTMPIPRTLFPLKPVDDSSREYNLWYQNVRLGAPSTEQFIGASPGLIGRELIKYGIFGPFTLFFWLGLILALADRLYSTGAVSDFHRIFAALLTAFIVAQARDFSPLWFLPFLPAAVIFGLVVRQARKKHPARMRMAHQPRLNPAN